MLNLTSLIDHPLFLVLTSAILALIGRAMFARWFSTSSRITAKMCELSQKACRDAIIAQMTLNNTILGKQIDGHTVRLTGGDGCFQEIKGDNDLIRKTLKVILITLLEICENNCCEKTKEKLKEEIEAL